MERFNEQLTLTSSEAAELLAVHPSTVKRWCNDGELPSAKTAGGHRRFHLGDLVAFARAKDIDTVLAPFHPYESHVWSAFRQVRDEGSFKRLHALAMGWVARGQVRRVSDLFSALAREEAVPFCTFCDQGVRGLMEKVGDAWAEGRLRVAEEHLVSQAMSEVLIGTRPDAGSSAAPPAAGAPVAVVGTMEGNAHHLGSLCVRLLLERMGWEVLYLGPDVPIEDFSIIQRRCGASLICVSLPPLARPGDAARVVRVLGEFYDPAHPYALALGGAAAPQEGDGFANAPFTRVGVFGSCQGIREAVSEGFAPVLEEVGA